MSPDYFLSEDAQPSENLLSQTKVDQE